MIVLTLRGFKGFMATIAVLIGLVLGTGVAARLGHTDFSGVATAAPIGFTRRSSSAGQPAAVGRRRLAPGRELPSRELLTALTGVGDIADTRFDSLAADANPIRSAWARRFEQFI